MKGTKSVINWFVLPFGSLKTMAIIFLVHSLGRAADTGSTYWFLSQFGFNLANEGNPISRISIILFGFWAHAAINLFIPSVLVLFISTIIFYRFRVKNLILAKTASAAVPITFGVLSLFVAGYNLGLFGRISLVFPFVILMLALIGTLIFGATILLLRRLGYAKQQNG